METIHKTNSLLNRGILHYFERFTIMDSCEDARIVSDGGKSKTIYGKGVVLTYQMAIQ